MLRSQFEIPHRNLAGFVSVIRGVRLLAHTLPEYGRVVFLATYAAKSAILSLMNSEMTSRRKTYSLAICLLILAHCLVFPCLTHALGNRTHFFSSGPGSAGAALCGTLVSRGVDSSAGFYNPATLIGLPSSVLIQYDQPNANANRSWLAMTAGDRRLKVGLLWKNETLP